MEETHRHIISFRLPNLLRQFTDPYVLLAHEREIPLRLTLSPGLPEWVMGDPAWLSQWLEEVFNALLPLPLPWLEVRLTEEDVLNHRFILSLLASWPPTPHAPDLHQLRTLTARGEGLVGLAQTSTGPLLSVRLPVRTPQSRQTLPAPTRLLCAGPCPPLPVATGWETDQAPPGPGAAAWLQDHPGTLLLVNAAADPDHTLLRGVRGQADVSRRRMPVVILLPEPLAGEAWRDALRNRANDCLPQGVAPAALHAGLTACLRVSTLTSDVIRWDQYETLLHEHPGKFSHLLAMVSDEFVSYQQHFGRAIRDGDVDDFRRLHHKIRPVMVMLGTDVLAEVLLTVKTQVINGQVAEQDARRLEEAFAQVLALLTRRLNEVT